MKNIRRMKMLSLLVLLVTLVGCGSDGVKKPEVVDLEGSPIVSPTGTNGNGQGTNLDSVNRQLSFQEATEYADLVLELDFARAQALYEEQPSVEFTEEDGTVWPEGADYRVMTTFDEGNQVIYYNESELPVWNETVGITYSYHEDGSLAFRVEEEQPTFYSSIEVSDQSILLNASLTSGDRLSFTVQVNDAKGFRIRDVYCENVNYEQFRKVFGEKDADSYVSAGVCIYETEYLWTENADESSTVSVQEKNGITYRRNYDAEGRLMEQARLYVQDGESRQDVERFDEKGNLVSEEHFIGERLEESLQYSNHYDVDRKLVQVEVFDDEMLQNTYTYRYEYDESKRVTRLVIEDKDGIAIREERTLYRR